MAQRLRLIASALQPVPVLPLQVERTEGRGEGHSAVKGQALSVLPSSIKAGSKVQLLAAEEPKVGAKFA